MKLRFQCDIRICKFRDFFFVQSLSQMVFKAKLYIPFIDDVQIKKQLCILQIYLLFYIQIKKSLTIHYFYDYEDGNEEEKDDAEDGGDIWGLPLISFDFLLICLTSSKNISFSTIFLCLF